VGCLMLPTLPRGRTAGHRVGSGLTMGIDWSRPERFTGDSNGSPDFERSGRVSFLGPIPLGRERVGLRELS
jgi:hypothetical protein